jgi:hypothetical protein
MNRTSLLVNKRRLPWERWGHEFALRYPQDAPELLAYIESKLGSTDFDTELDRLLAEMKDDFTVPTAVPRKSRQKASNEEDPNGVTKPHGERLPPNPDQPRKPRPEPDPDREIRHRASPNGRKRYKVIDSGKRTMLQNQNEQRPAVKILTEEEYSYSFRGRAAEYAKEATAVFPSGIIYINRDFDALEKLIDESVNLYVPTGDARERALPAVRKIVELVYTAQILFAVMTYRTRSWSATAATGQKWIRKNSYRRRRSRPSYLPDPGCASRSNGASTAKRNSSC